MFLVIPKGAQKFTSVIIYNHHSGSKVQQNTLQNPKVMQSEATLLFETIVTKYNTGGGVLCHVWWNSVMLKSKRQWHRHFLFCRMRGRSQKDLNTHVVVCSLKINFWDSWLITGRVAQCQWHSAPSWPGLGLLNSRRLPSTFSKELIIQSLAFCIFNANENAVAVTTNQQQRLKESYLFIFISTFKVVELPHEIILQIPMVQRHCFI